LPEDAQELLDAPSWEDIDALLKNQQIRCYRIDIETDSTIKADQEAEEQSRIKFITAAGGFIKEATQVQNPIIQPLLMEMLMFGVRSMKAGRELEGEFKEVMIKLKKEAENPQAKPDPAAAEMQMKQQQAQMDLDITRQKNEMDAQQRAQEQQTQAAVEQRRNELEDARAQQALINERDLAREKLQADKELAVLKANLDAENAEKLAILNAQLKAQQLDAETLQKQAETGYIDPTPIVNGILEHLTGIASKLEMSAQAHMRPKIITLDNGRTAKVGPT
jgi:hypothetical protein